MECSIVYQVLQGFVTRHRKILLNSLVVLIKLLEKDVCYIFSLFLKFVFINSFIPALGGNRMVRTYVGFALHCFAPILFRAEIVHPKLFHSKYLNVLLSLVHLTAVKRYFLENFFNSRRWNIYKVYSQHMITSKLTDVTDCLCWLGARQSDCRHRL